MKLKTGLILAIPILMIAVLCACPGGSYTQQVIDQGGSSIQIASATYLDALKWYNNAQEAFIEQIKIMPKAARVDPEVREQVKAINDKFNEAGDILDKWKMAMSLAEMDTQSAAFKRVTDELIDAGLWYFVDKKEVE